MACIVIACYSYGLYRHGLNSYGLCSYGLYSHCLFGYGLFGFWPCLVSAGGCIRSLDLGEEVLYVHGSSKAAAHIAEAADVARLAAPEESELGVGTDGTIQLDFELALARSLTQDHKHIQVFVATSAPSNVPSDVP